MMGVRVAIEKGPEAMQMLGQIPMLMGYSWVVDWEHSDCMGQLCVQLSKSTSCIGDMTC